MIHLTLPKDSAAVIIGFLNQLSRLDEKNQPWSAAEFIALTHLQDTLINHPELPEFQRSGYGPILERAQRNLLSQWASPLTDRLKIKPVDFDKIFDYFAAYLQNNPQFSDKLSFEEMLYLVGDLYWPAEKLEELKELLNDQIQRDSEKFTDRGEGLISRHPLFNLLLKAAGDKRC